MQYFSNMKDIGSFHWQTYIGICCNCLAFLAICCKLSLWKCDWYHSMKWQISTEECVCIKPHETHIKLNSVVWSGSFSLFLYLEFHIFVSYVHKIVHLLWTGWSRLIFEKLIAQIVTLVSYFSTCQCVSCEQQCIRMTLKFVSPRIAVIQLISAIKNWPLEIVITVVRICNKVITCSQSFEMLVLMLLLCTMLGRFQLFWKHHSLYLLG